MTKPTARKAIAALCLAVICVLIAVAVSPVTTHPGASRSARSVSVVTAPPEGSRIEMLGGAVNEIGFFTYPDAYVGVVLADRNTALTVYVARSRDLPALEQEVMAQDPPAATSHGRIPVRFVVEPMGQDAFGPILHFVTGRGAQLDGIMWSGTTLDAPSDTLEVTVVHPSRAALTALATALRIAERTSTSPNVDSANYLASANRLLQLEFGSHVRVVGYAPLVTPI